MKTQVMGAEGIDLAAKLIREGEVVAFPTETVYGLGGDCFNDDAVKRIYAAKGRPSDNPLIVHISTLSDVYRVAKDVPDAYFRLAEKFLPGPLTVILPKADDLPLSCTGGLDTVAVRYPAHKMARDFIKATGTLIAAPSANVSTHVSPTTAKHVYDDLNGRIPLILDGGECEGGIESTIITLCREIPTILRPGIITERDLSTVLNEVELFKGKVEKAEAPGMKYKHYAPKAPLTLLEGEPSKMAAAFRRQVRRLQGVGRTVGVLASHEVCESLQGLVPAELLKDYGPQGDLLAIAAHIYEELIAFNDTEADALLGEGTTEKGLGLAIMNRLHKASGFHSIKIS